MQNIYNLNAKPIPGRFVRHWHTLSGQDAIARLKSDCDGGLSPGKAERRLQKYGPNRLPEAGRRGIPLLFLDQFRDLMIQILLVAAIVAAFIGAPQDAIAILVIVILNALIGVVQQYRAENAISALRQIVLCGPRPVHSR